MISPALTLDEVHAERDRLQLEIQKINVTLAKTLPMGRYSALNQRKRELGVKHQECLMRIRQLRSEQKVTLAQAFMTTTIEMFDPQDVTEIWDRLYINYPHLKM